MICVSPVRAPPDYYDPNHPLIYEVNLTGSREETFELNGSALASTTTTLELFDTYGNPRKVIVESSDGHKKTTENTFAAVNTANWIVDRMLSSQVTTVKPGLPDGLRKSSFTYQGIAGGSCSSAPLGYLCTETIEPNSR